MSDDQKTEASAPGETPNEGQIAQALDAEKKRADTAEGQVGALQQELARERETRVAERRQHDEQHAVALAEVRDNARRELEAERRDRAAEVERFVAVENYNRELYDTLAANYNAVVAANVRLNADLVAERNAKEWAQLAALGTAAVVVYASTKTKRLRG